MDYIAFALKYRPQNFEEVVGQEHVVTALKGAILKKHIHHAYLFSGPRGTGKTSLARIFAKALNCQSANEPVVKSCGKCASCLEISKANSLDVIEIDGASNRGIDEIRTLRENVKLSPAHSRYKVYIIDEVHMLTQEAFNALLKTLEEPPPHVKFIFATTHPHKVLPTILSRCQKFQFGLLPLEEIVAKLKKIVHCEGLKFDEAILYAIARAGAGSIRDCESLLDQLVPVMLEKGSIEDIFSFLGIIDEDSLSRMLKFITEKDLASCLNFIDKIVKDGKDLGIFLNALIEHTRNLLLAKVSLQTFNELIDISFQAKEAIANCAKAISATQALELIDSLIEAKELSHRLNTVRVPFELVLIRFLKPKDISMPAQQSYQAVQEESPKAQLSKEQTRIQPIPSNNIEGNFNLDEEEDAGQENSNIAEDSNTQTSDEDEVLLKEIKLKWGEIIVSMQKVRAAIASHLSCGQPYFSKAGTLKIGFSNNDGFHKEILEDTKNTKFIEEMISKVIGNKINVKFILSEKIASASSNNQTENGAQGNEVDIKNENAANVQNELINELMDNFGGQFHTEDE
jgi:DNA polymerase-3 subunit gamma/tau